MNIITAEDVREGDKIKVTYQHGQVECTRTGVADNFTDFWRSGKRAWLTSDGTALATQNTDAVIELLERTVALPNKDKAVVKYSVASFDPANPDRTAIRDGAGKWTAYDPEGAEMDTHYSDEDFAEWLGDFSHEVVFEGVAQW